jgi:hypothetical protein
MYERRVRLEGLFVQVSVWPSKKELDYYELCQFTVIYEFVMFYSTRAKFTILHFLRNLPMSPIS